MRNGSTSLSPPLEPTSTDKRRIRENRNHVSIDRKDAQPSRKTVTRPEYGEVALAETSFWSASSRVDRPNPLLGSRRRNITQHAIISIPHPIQATLKKGKRKRVASPNNVLACTE